MSRKVNKSRFLSQTNEIKLPQNGKKYEMKLSQNCKQNGINHFQNGTQNETNSSQNETKLYQNGVVSPTYCGRLHDWNDTQRKFDKNFEHVPGKPLRNFEKFNHRETQLYLQNKNANNVVTRIRNLCFQTFMNSFFYSWPPSPRNILNLKSMQSRWMRFLGVLFVVSILTSVSGSPLSSSSHGNRDSNLKHNNWYAPGDLSENDVLYVDEQTEPYFYDSMINSPATETEHQRIQNFDKTKLNFTQIRLLLETLPDVPHGVSGDRSGRFMSYFEPVMPKFLKDMGIMMDLETAIREVETSIMTSVSCNACIGGVGLLLHYIENGNSANEIIRASSKICANFRIETPRVCHGIIEIMAGEVVYVFNNLVMKPEKICGLLIGSVCGIPVDPKHEWDVVFPPIPKPTHQIVRPPKDGQTTLKVLHLSDTHFDPYYLEGSNADCNEPMCCRATSGKPKTAAAKAGFWGDYRKCDTPERTIRSMYEHIAETHQDIDYIMWTGDLPAHDIWNQTKASNTEALRDTVQQLLSYFPNTPIFPALGNHESVPVNSFPPSYVPRENSVQWLYDELDKQWRHWLPPYTSATVRDGGFYAVQILPNFRLISLNMNFCNNKNWWLLVDSEDPALQLQWLIYELQASELREEKVHIIGHIPPGHHDCLQVWSRNFYQIINRYEDTVTGQFYGHTHTDEIELFYDQTPNQPGLPRPTNVAYIAPSTTSYVGLNPGYRIYEVDLANDTAYRVVDHETWIMDLSESNKLSNVGREPIWFLEYSARHAYAMRSLLPVDWDNLIYRMVHDKELFNMFHRFYWKESVAREACDTECKKRILCDLKSGRSHDRKNTCQDLFLKVEAQERSQWTNWVFGGFNSAYSWVMSMFGY